MNNLDKYSRAGSVGAMGGQSVNSSGNAVINKVIINQFNGSGVRIRNVGSTNLTINQKYSTSGKDNFINWDGAASYPPFVDIIYIRRDLLSICC